MNKHRFTLEELDKLHKERVPQILTSTNDGSNFMARLTTSFTDDPVEKQNILRNLGIDQTPHDPMGFDIGDVADFAGQAPTAILGTLGTFLGGRIGQPTKGAAYGGMLGEQISQGVGKMLGAEKTDPVDVLTEAALAATGDKVFGGAAVKAVNPLAAKALDSRITEQVIKPATDFGIEKSLLPASRTTSKAVANAETRIGNASNQAGENFRNVVRENSRAAQQNALEGIAGDAGLTTRATVADPDKITEAAGATLEQRETVVGKLFDDFRASIDSPETIPVDIDQTEAALNRMARRTQAADLPDSDITAAIRAQIKSLNSDLVKVKNFKQMDAFRRKIGDMLRSNDQMEALRSIGADREFRDIYGGLSRDIEETIAQGQLARDFGGQTGGRIINPNPGGVAASKAETQASKNALRQWAEQGPEVVKRVEDTQQLDNLAASVDETLLKRTEANAAFQDLLNLEGATIVKILKDPDQAAGIFDRLFNKGANVANLKKFKQKIGAVATEGGLPASREGMDAWRDTQAQLLRQIRERGEDVFLERGPGGAVPFNGKAMTRALEALGGEDVLDEALGAAIRKDLYSFADFTRQAAPIQRAFNSISTSAEDPQGFGIFNITIAKKAFQMIFDKAASALGFPGKGLMSQYLTKGLAPEAGQQGIIRTIGAGTGQAIGRTVGQVTDPAFPAGRSITPGKPQPVR